MTAAILPDHMPYFRCEDGHEQWSPNPDLDRCLHGGCDLPVVRLCADGRRYTPRSKRA